MDSYLSQFTKQVKVAVLAGGIGTERQISLQSGKYVAEALRQAGLAVTVADVTPERLEVLEDSSIDVFFLALHGQFGEDGRIQQILEDKALIYTGSGPKACALAMDKAASKKLFIEAGIRTPPAVEFDPDIPDSALKNRIEGLGDTYVIKPSGHGSSVGISVAHRVDDAVDKARWCRTRFGDCIIEEFITGRELTVGILCGSPLPIIEIKPEEKFYNYKAKYDDESTKYLFDTIEDKNLVEKIQTRALACFDCLGLKDFARIDFILTDDGEPNVLEANTIPGFTTHSCLPKAAAKTGISMTQLCVNIAEAALKNKNVKTVS